jgi:protein required for attachment to host cells
MTQSLSWIVLADGSRGRILVQERLGAPLKRAYDEEDLADDRTLAPAPGRAAEPHEEPNDKAEHAFCQFVADLINRAAKARRFQRLILVAPPHMLGGLRKSLAPQARALVSAELTKNWLRLTDADVTRGLGDALLSPMATQLVHSGF